MNKLKEISAIFILLFMVYEAITNYEETKEIFLKAFKKSIDNARIEAENKFRQKYGNTYTENTETKEKVINKNQEENSIIQFEGKVLSIEIKDNSKILKVKRYDKNNIEYISTTEEKLQKEKYKIENGYDFIFVCNKRNKSYLEECTLY